MKKTFIILTLLLLTPATFFAQQWESVGGGMTSGPQIRDIWVDTLTDEIYVSGDFVSIGGVSAGGVAKWGGTNWIDMCSECSNHQIFSVLKYHDTLYIAGSFWLPEFVPTYAARLTTNGWESIADTQFTGSRLYLSGDSLYLMGAFDTVNGNPISKVALWHDDSWIDPFPQNNFFDEPGFSYIGEMVNYQGDFIVGGNFDFDDLSEIAKYENNSWFSVGGGLLGNALIEEMIIYKGILYIGGTFFQDAGNAADYLMAWNGSEFFNPFPEVEFTYNIRDLQIFNDELYIVSQFNYVNDPTTYFFAKFDGENFCSFGGSFPSIFDVSTSPPKHIRELNGELYVVCSSMLFNDTVNNIAHWLGSEMDTCIYSPVSAIIELPKNQTNYQLFPNPAENAVQISWHAVLPGEQLIVIYDQLGKAVLTQKNLSYMGENTLTLDISKLSKGLYHIDTGSGRFKIVKH